MQENFDRQSTAQANTRPSNCWVFLTTDIEKATKGSVAWVSALISLISGVQAYLRLYKIDFSAFSGHLRSLHTQILYPYKRKTTTNLKKIYISMKPSIPSINWKSPLCMNATQFSEIKDSAFCHSNISVLRWLILYEKKYVQIFISQIRDKKIYYWYVWILYRFYMKFSYDS